MLAMLMGILLIPASECVTVDCVTCSYTFAGDGSTDYQCVNDVHNFTKTSTASCSSGLCTIRTVYTNGFGRIKSLFRGCGTSVLNGCDQPESVYPTCTVTCSTPQCNDQNGDLRASLHANNPGGGGGGGGGGGSACSLGLSHLIFTMPLLCIILHL
ncbi:hypothetical protein PoB_004067300 [Plakobranchus ocellatus]|uniref:UPAR/Ly6 domain-containing protein n=1 Tax=Plakobranchus ocellatus TaxID=259542 RepID=A0AAV4B3L2_9GAST|nr:hypothetical protein PoB_004067300 [Plakobranchus ocellatus]